MAQKRSSIEDSLWEILDSHPDFASVPRAKQRWAYDELWDQILNADPDNPISVEHAAERQNKLFAELGLRPIAEAQALFPN